MNEKLRFSAASGIVTLATMIPIIIFEVSRILGRLSSFFSSIYIFTMVASLLFYLIFIYGFYIIGEKLKLGLVKVMVIVSMAVYSIYMIYYIGTISFLPSLANNVMIGLALVFVMGVVETMFGAALLHKKLQKKFGKLAKYNAVLSIIAGISFLTVIFAIIGLLLTLPVYIAGIMLLFRASKKFK